MNEDDEEWIVCHNCEGNGFHEECDGAGYVACYQCHYCHGEGYVTKKYIDEVEEVNAKIKDLLNPEDKHDFDDVALF